MGWFALVLQFTVHSERLVAVYTVQQWRADIGVAQYSAARGDIGAVCLTVLYFTVQQRDDIGGLEARSKTRESAATTVILSPSSDDADDQHP